MEKKKKKIEPRNYVFWNEGQRKNYIKKELKLLYGKLNRSEIDNIAIECFKKELGI